MVHSGESGCARRVVMHCMVYISVITGSLYFHVAASTCFAYFQIWEWRGWHRRDDIAGTAARMRPPRNCAAGAGGSSNPATHSCWPGGGKLLPVWWWTYNFKPLRAACRPALQRPYLMRQGVAATRSSLQSPSLAVKVHGAWPAPGHHGRSFKVAPRNDLAAHEAAGCV